MWRRGVLLVAVLGWASLAGCQGASEPAPLTPDQEREMEQQVQQVHDAERAHFSQESAPGEGNR